MRRVAESGESLGVGAEGPGLGLEAHDEGVGHGAPDRDAVTDAGADVAGAVEAGEVGEAGEGVGGVEAVGASRPEVDDGATGGGVGGPGRLGSHQGLEADAVEQVGLNDLGFDDGGADLDDGFVGEDDLAFLNAARLAGETEPAEGVEESCVEESQRVEVGEVFGSEVQGGEVIEAFLDAGGDEVAAAGGQRAKEQAEGGPRVHAPPPEGLGHRQLVEVGEEGVREVGWHEGSVAARHTPRTRPRRAGRMAERGFLAGP